MDTEGSSGGGGEIFQHPVAQPQPVVSIPPCSSIYYKFKQHKCPHCSFRSNHRHVVTRHAESKHNEKKKKKAVIEPPPPPSIDSGGGGGGGGGGGDTDDDDDDDEEVGDQFNVQLEPDFKIFLAGPSKSGKTNFCSQLLANLSTIAKSKPATTIYVYATWQSKLKEMKRQGLVDIFLHGGHDLEERLKRAHVTSPRRPTLIIFDDMMMEKSTLPYIAKLFAIGRHSKLSLIFITQKIFIDDDSLRIIRENSDYYVLMKNPTNVRSVSQLVGRLNPNPSLVSNIFLNATHNKPYSYLFCNVTQGASPQTQYLSELFERDHIVTSYVIESNMSRKKTTFHKMYLVSAEKLEKVRRRIDDDDDPNLGCSKPSSSPPPLPEDEEMEEVVPPSPPPPPLPPPSVEQPPPPPPAAAAVELPRRDIGAGLDDYPPIPVVDPDLDEEEEDEVMAEVEKETAAAAAAAATKCTQCGQSFKNAKGLKIHTKKKHPLAIVKKNFKKRLVHPAAVQELKIKKSGRHGRGGGHCYCKICYEEFTSRQAYNQHVEEKHLAGWKVNLNKMNVDDDDDDDDDGEITLSDLDNPMEDEEERSVEKRLESNKKKAKLNRKILSKYKQQRQKRVVVVEKAKKKKKKKKKKKAKKDDDDDDKSCRHCQKRFTSASELKDHFIAEHQK